MRSLEEEATSVQVKARTATEVLLTDIGESLNDAGNADRFVDQYADQVLYVKELRAWLHWSEGHWRFDNFGEIMGLAENLARQLFFEAAQTQHQATRTLVSRWANASLQLPRLKAMVELAQPKLSVSVTQLDANPWLLGVRNGVVDLRSGVFRAAERGDFITKIAGVAFDHQATCPQWEAFVSSSMNGNQSLIALLQVAAGYSLTGSTAEQVFFFLYGAGANGKSTFVNALRELMGANGIQSPSETIMAQRSASASGPSPDIARLAGVRFVAMVETEDGQRLAESRLKQMTGGDAMTARVLYGSLFDFTPVLKLWLSGNHKPVIRGDDYGIWRRIVLIPFEVVLKKEQRDKHLPDKLRAEFPGILNWLIRGCLVWQKSGLQIPDEVRVQVEQYKSSMDLLALWLSDCCDELPSSQCRARAAYESFAKWCKQGGHNPISEVRFAQKMNERGYVAEHNRNGKVYLGLSAKQSELVFCVGSS
jgi:putative DNA primase/helicase